MEKELKHVKIKLQSHTKSRNHSKDEVDLAQNDNNIKMSKPKVHSKSEHIKCEECGFICQAKKTLIIHVEIINNKSAKKVPVKTKEKFNIKAEGLKCTHCAIKFTVLIVMEKHMTCEHKFKCEICAITFKEESKLDNHLNNDHNNQFW